MRKINDLKKLLKAGHLEKLIIAVGVVGIILLAMPQNKEKTKIQPDFGEGSYTHWYLEDTEEKLTEILENIEGVGEASVMITLSSSEEVIYAQNEKESTDFKGDGLQDKTLQKESSRREKTYVFSDYGNRSALKISSTEPKIKGVIVVCTGGGNPVIKAEVTEACSTVLGIRYGNIFVAKSN